MWGLVGGAILVLDFAYHRWLAPKPPRSRINAQAVTLPRTDLGGPIPLVFGWTNVKSPFLAYCGTPQTTTATDPDTGDDIYRTYAVDMVFVCGIPMGKGVTRGNRLAGPKLVRVWYGDKVLPPALLPSVVGAGVFDGKKVIRDNWNGGPGLGGGMHGTYFWFGGWTDQRFDSPQTRVGAAMAARSLAARGDAELFGGLPNQMCIAFASLNPAVGIDDSSMLLDDIAASTGVVLPSTGFSFGESPNIQGISVEVQTYGDRVNDVTHQHIFSMKTEGVDFGGDADPVEVIYCILTDTFGKLGLSPDLIDLDSFAAASATLKAEGHGYSRAFEEGQTAQEMIQDVMRQIDAAGGFSYSTGKWTLKLIRNDYSVPDLPEINRTNCKELQNVSIVGLSGVPNKMKVTYRRRASGYATVPVTSQNLANAVGQDGLVVESVLDFEGIKNDAIAQAVCDRELAAVSRSLIKCTAVCDRSLLSLNVGDPVKLTWTGPDISGLVFRVANINRGTLADPSLKIDLIQDAFYTWRAHAPVDTGFGGHDATGLDGIVRG